MPINIVYPLSGSSVPSGFTASGYADVLKVAGTHSGLSAEQNVDAMGNWSMPFTGASGKHDLTVAKSPYTNSNDPSATETHITAGAGGTAPTIEFAVLPPPTVAAEADALAMYPVAGKSTGAAGIICTVVERNANNQIKKILASSIAKVQGNGDWTAEVFVDAPGQGKRHTVYAYAIGKDGQMSCVGSLSKPQ